MMRTMLSVFLCVGLILCGGCGRAVQSPSATETPDVVSSAEPVDNMAPYLIQYQEQKYVNWGGTAALNSTAGLTELGQIQSTVPGNRAPEESLQSNIGLVGHTLWRDGERLLLESDKSGVYLIFELYEYGKSPAATLYQDE